MDAAKEEMRKIARAENKAFWVGFSLAMLVALAAINVFLLLFVVPKFEQIFSDALPGKPLPGATNFIIGYRLLLMFVAIGWPLACGALRSWWRVSSTLWVDFGIIYFLLEIGSTIIALLMPMLGGTTGVSDSNHP